MVEYFFVYTLRAGPLCGGALPDGYIITLIGRKFKRHV